MSPRPRPSFAARVGPPVLTLVVATLAAEAWVRGFSVSPLLLPTPSAVLRALVVDRAILLPAVVQTAGSVLLGLGASVALGIAAAIAFASSRWIERAFYPYAIFFQIVPIVAVAPLLVIWLGYGQRAVIAAAFLVSVFPIVANTLAGLRSVEPPLRDLFRLYGAGRAATLWKLALPSALPFVLTGLRIAAGLAVIGAIVGEFVSGGGLGTVILTAMRQQRPDLVFAAILDASGLGLVLFAAVSGLSHHLLRHWHSLENDR